MDWDNVYKDIFDQIEHIAVCLVDLDGIIRYINDAYLKILELNREDVMGRPLKEITPHTRTHLVAESGKAIVGYNWKIKDHNMIASSVPVVKDGKLVGVFAYSIFMDIVDARDMVEQLMAELNMYKNELSTIHQAKYGFDELIGENREFLRIKNLAMRIAGHPDTTVLITGESGTGKELIANAIHRGSRRCSRPFIRVNCAAIPENLLEAELFGYEEGAYTGALKGGKPGKFELAQGGTVFLDEIAEMSPAMQAKLLVVLQEQEVERLGGRRPVKIDVRIIAATNRNLEQMVKEERFREDLYFRLNVFRLELLPLRGHKEDIEPMAWFFIRKLGARLHVKIEGVSQEALESLNNYNWPGNVRELVNVLERAMIMADMEGSRRLEASHFGFLNKAYERPSALGASSLKDMTDEFERHVISAALQEAGGDRNAAARLLGIDLSTLYRKLKKYGFPE